MLERAFLFLKHGKLRPSRLANARPSIGDEFSAGAQPRTFSKLGIHFLGLGYCTEQNTDGTPSFVHCSLLRNGNHTIHKKLGWSVQIWGSGPPPLRPFSGCALGSAAKA